MLPIITTPGAEGNALKALVVEHLGETGSLKEIPVPKPGTKAAKDLPSVQLYDLSADIGEKQNVQDQHPEIVQRLTRLLEKYVADGRSTPGAPQKNDVSINLWKDQIDIEPGNPKSAAIDRGD